jgi:hypothetical protein
MGLHGLLTGIAFRYFYERKRRNKVKLCGPEEFFQMLSP